MNIPRRRFRTMPPSIESIELTAWAKALPMDDLRLLAAIVQSEMDQRIGREKFRLPDHVQRLLN